VLCVAVCNKLINLQLSSFSREDQAAFALKAKCLTRSGCPCQRAMAAVVGVVAHSCSSTLHVPKNLLNVQPCMRFKAFKLVIRAPNLDSKSLLPVLMVRTHKPALGFARRSVLLMQRASCWSLCETALLYWYFVIWRLGFDCKMDSSLLVWKIRIQETEVRSLWIAPYNAAVAALN
jgi:hypothetical protein